MIIMSVDLGKARTGIAISDQNENFAFPKTVITEYNTENLVLKITEIAKAEKAEQIVVGNPKNMDGSEGWRSKECKETAQKIFEISGIETIMWDERCTTVSAHTALNFTDTKGKKRKQIIDAVAAVIILEDYLNFKKNQKGL